MECPWPWLGAEVVVGVADSFPQDDPIKTTQAQQEPHKVLRAKAKAEVTEPGVEVEVVDKMAVLEVAWSPATPAAFQVKMATVWHPEVV